MSIVLKVKSVRVLGSAQFGNMGEDGYLHPGKALLQPLAAKWCEAFVEFLDQQYGVKAYFSDMFRVAADQAALCRIRGKYGEPPGFSGHNVGLSFDLHTNRMFAQFRCSQKPYSLRKLRADLKAFGWSHDESRMWHFDYLAGRSSMKEVLEQDFGNVWGDRLTLDTVGSMLTMIGYKVKVDVSEEEALSDAVLMFQKDFALEATGKMNSHTRRALVTASMMVELI